MNKKVIIIASLAILLLFSAIFIGRKLAIKNNEVIKESDALVNEDSIKEDSKLKTENNVNNKDYSNIVLDSKVGLELSNLIRVPNIYSEEYYKILDNYGLTNEAKKIFAYARIATDEDYKSYLRYSEKYVGSYITKKDLEEVLQKFFGKELNVEHSDIISDTIYDEENGNYIINAMGICGVDIKYTLDVPYKMLQYDDRIEVYVYRIYVTQNITDELSNVKNEIYSDAERNNKLFEITDTSLDNELTQSYELFNKINENYVDTSNLNTGIYTIKGIDSSMYIDNYKRF